MMKKIICILFYFFCSFNLHASASSSEPYTLTKKITNKTLGLQSFIEEIYCIEGLLRNDDQDDFCIIIRTHEQLIRQNLREESQKLNENERKENGYFFYLYNTTKNCFVPLEIRSEIGSENVEKFLTRKENNKDTMNMANRRLSIPILSGGYQILNHESWVNDYTIALSKNVVVSACSQTIYVWESA
ncbi:MAG: hypothetical protein CMP11_05760 [Zetaproteobacteria bacterium]|nr:hypothetical protein [Pseudobdellovibrionaceae bacterium]